MPLSKSLNTACGDEVHLFSTIFFCCVIYTLLYMSGLDKRVAGDGREYG